VWLLKAGDVKARQDEEYGLETNIARHSSHTLNAYDLPGNIASHRYNCWIGHHDYCEQPY
jgi:hypothetical protein